MAFVECSKCGKLFSSKAPKCPHCLSPYSPVVEPREELDEDVSSFDETSSHQDGDEDTASNDSSTRRDSSGEGNDCPYCGELGALGASTCKSCGSNLSAQPDETLKKMAEERQPNEPANIHQREPVSAAKKDAPEKLGQGCAVGCLVILGLIFLLGLLGGNDDNKPTKRTSYTESDSDREMMAACIILAESEGLVRGSPEWSAYVNACAREATR